MSSLRSDLSSASLARLIEQLPADAVVGSLEVNGYRVWVKRTQGAGTRLSRVKASLFVLVARYLGRGLPMSRPIPAAQNSCPEAARLSYYATLGVSVPRVLYAQPDHFIIEDAGLGLRDELEACEDPAERARALDEALENLADLHRQREWHGGAQLRNLMRHDGRLVRIDFEEPYAGRVALPLLQVLDLCLQLSSTDRYSTAAHRQAMGRQWFAAVGTGALGTAARRVLRLLQGLAGLSLLRLARYEHRRVCAAIDALEGAIEQGEQQGLARRPYRPAMPFRWRMAAIGFALMLAADDVLEFALEHDDHPDDISQILIHGVEI